MNERYFLAEIQSFEFSERVFSLDFDSVAPNTKIVVPKVHRFIECIVDSLNALQDSIRNIDFSSFRLFQLLNLSIDGSRYTDPVTDGEVVRI